MPDESSFDTDAMWSALQEMFTKGEAIFFRRYPVRIEYSVREIDYVFYHRSGTLGIVYKALFDKDQKSELNSGADEVIFFDNVLEEKVSEHPKQDAEQLLKALQRILSKSVDDIGLPINRNLILLWVPRAVTREQTSDSSRKSVPHDQLFYIIGGNPDPNALRETLHFGAYAPNLSESEAWVRAKEILQPPPTIRDRSQRLDEFDLSAAIELADSYTYEHGKSTLIFISHRRDDAGWAAGRLYAHLKQVFRSPIFFDFDSIKPGVNWADAIDEALDACILQLVVMGPQWATLTRNNSQTPRILEPGDMVAHEVRTAIRKKKVIIPILIDGAPMPNKVNLPTGLRDLPMRQGMHFTQDNFFAKFDVLTERIIELLQLAVSP